MIDDLDAGPPLALPVDLEGHWYRAAVTPAASEVPSGVRVALFRVGPITQTSHPALMNLEIRGKLRSFRGVITRSDRTGRYSWRGPLGWRVVSRRRWELRANSARDLIAAAGPPSMTSNESVVLFVACGLSRDEAARKALDDHQQLGLMVRQVLNLRWLPTPTPAHVAISQQRWAER